MAKTIFEEMGGRYEKQGDYILTVPPEEEKPIGVFGQRHLWYLREYRKVTYTNLLISGRLKRLPCRDRRAGKGYVFSAGKGICRQAGHDGAAESGQSP